MRIQFTAGPVLRIGLLLALLLAVGVGLAGSEPSRSGGGAERPNIIVLLVDTLRADHLGSYGFEGPISPRLDALAGESVRFENVWTTAPWTKPAIASLFTSLPPEVHGVVNHDGRYAGARAEQTTDVLPAGAATLAEALRARGYETAAVVANPWIGQAQGFAQGFDSFDEKTTGNYVRARRILARAREWLEARESERPFFLYLHLMDVHGPYAAPDADFAALAGAPGLGERRALTESETVRLRPYQKRTRWYRADATQRLEVWRGRYAAGVRAMDRQVGVFLDALRERGLLSASVLVVTSDHGEELADHGDWDHGHHLYEEQIRVPLLLRMPSGRPAVVGEVVSLLDLMPTLLGVAGAPAPSGMYGRDLRPLLAEGVATEARPVFAGGVKRRPEWRAVRVGDGKAIRAERLRAFDLAADPREQADLAASRPGLVTPLRAALDRWGRELKATPGLAREQTVVPDEMRKRLEALGYASEGTGRDGLSPQ